MTNKASFQVITMNAPHTCIPFSFEQGKRHMSYDWLADTYRHAFRLQPSLRARNLESIFKEKHNYNATLWTCMRISRKALNSIIGDYRGQFRQIRDYLWEVYKQNSGGTVKVKTWKDSQEKYIFRFVYIYRVALIKGFSPAVEGYPRYMHAS